MSWEMWVGCLVVLSVLSNLYLLSRLYRLEKDHEALEQLVEDVTREWRRPEYSPLGKR